MSAFDIVHYPLNVVTLEYLIERKTRPFESGLVILNANDSLESGLKKLAGSKILSAPVFFAVEKKWGMIDMMDISVALMRSKESISQSIGYFCNSSGVDNIVTLDSTATILGGVDAMVKHNVHRILVLKDDKPFDLVSQMDIVRWVVKNWDQLPETLRKQKMLHLRSETMITAKSTDLVVDVFNKMISTRVTGLAIVDETNQLVTSLSISNLRGMTSERLNALLKLDVKHFLEETKQYLQKPPVTVDVDDTFEMALKKMQTEHVHRVFVVQGKNPIGVFSTTDAMSLISAALK